MIFVQRMRTGGARAVSTVAGRALVRSRHRCPQSRQGADQSGLPRRWSPRRHVGSGAEISHFEIHRPSLEGMFSDLFRLMQEIGAVVYRPGSRPCSAVTDAAIIPELPAHMLECLGPPAIVTSGHDILNAIRR